MKKRIILIIGLQIFLVSLLAETGLNFEGYLEASYGANYEADEFEWNIWDPNINFEGRFWSNPYPGSNVYFKFYSDKDNDTYKEGNSSLAVLTEGHASYKLDNNGFGFESILFTREGGRYWLDGSMLDLLNSGSVNNDSNGQGIRWDFWLPAMSMTYIVSDFSSGNGDDVHLGRLRKELMSGKLRMGLTYQRKNYYTGNKKDYNMLLAGDMQYQMGNYYLSWELAGTSVPSEEDVTEATKSINELDSISEIMEQNLSSKIEISGFKTGSYDLGYIAITPGAYFIGDKYRNFMGNNDKNKSGWWINSYYLVPQRAITFTCNYSYSENTLADTLIDQDNEERLTYNPVSNLYTEAYIEFINGFKWRIYFNKKDEEWQGNDYQHYDLFTELQVENRLAKLMTQFKIKDMGEVTEKQLWGIECSVNLNQRWKLFSRGMVANDRGGSRFSIFGELSYKIGGNTEAYIQYGPSWWGQYGLVNDDGFASGGEMKEEIRFLLKSWF